MANFLELIHGEGAAVQIIKSLIETDLPGSKIIEHVRAHGYGIRTQTAYEVIKHLREVVKPAEEYIKHLGLNNLPNIARLPLSVTKQLRNFAYRVELQGFSKATGELDRQSITVSSNQILTKQQAIDAAVSMAENSGASYGVTGASGSVAGVYQNSAGLVEPGIFDS